MCGIAGIWSSQCGDDDIRTTLSNMTESLQHRGPDDVGLWADVQAGLGLGHRRLSVIDLTAAGHQPMISSSGRYCIVLNGEIYNFQEIRKQLQALGHCFRGHSDTEVLIEAVQEWGIEQTLPRLNGMFAFAVWDASLRLLYLVRDRLGVKPLYYGWAGRDFLFASELKALAAVPRFKREVDRESLAAYFRHGYVPAPQSIYHGARKVCPGHFVVTGEPELRSHRCRTVCYWDLPEIVEAAEGRLFSGTAEEAISCLDDLLRDSIRLRMTADVPLGAFLSGGVDSSTVVALMQAQSTRPIKTFTIGFTDSNYDESPYARRVARHLGTDHTEVYVTPDEAMSVIPQLPSLYDEPFGDSSAIPTSLVSLMARQHVTVSLSGDGGDEMFSGYTRYVECERLWSVLGRMPRWARESARALVGIVRRTASGRLHRRMKTVQELLALDSEEGVYERQMTIFPDEERVAAVTRERPTTPNAARTWPKTLSLRRKMMLADAMHYLPDDILVKLDRASMGVSLEAREPLLDYRVVEFASRLPLDHLIRSGNSKWILRSVLGRYVPTAFMDRPKRGFAIPRNDWLRGPLRDWAEGLFNETRLKREGYLNAVLVRRLWQEHLTSRGNWGTQLWCVAMFQAWLEKWTPTA